MLQTFGKLLSWSVAFMTVSAGTALAAYQLVFDGEDTAWRTASASWELDKTGAFLGNYKFSAAGPGTGNQVCVWDIDGIPSGTYQVEFYCDNGNFAQGAQYIFESDAGESTVTRSQNYVGTGWHVLGTFDFTNAGRITQTDFWTGSGNRVISDALRLTLLTELPTSPGPGSVSPEVTLVIDDLGALNPNASSSYTYQLFADAPDVTYAAMPFLAYTTQVLQKAQTLGIETILHQPMQYIGQSDTNPSDSTRLYIGQSSSQWLATLNSNLNNVAPYVEGLNNHQGSRFSQFDTGLNVVLDDLKTRNLFFLDSRTISDSKAYDIAKKKGLLTGERDLFVDGATVANTQALIESVAQQAIFAPNYNYIMICHQREFTVPGVFLALDTLETSGVKLKRLDRNLHYIVEADNIPNGASVEVSGSWTSTTRDMISHELDDGIALERPVTGTGVVRFRPNLPKSGYYRVFAATGSSPDLGAATLRLHSRGGDVEFNVPQGQARNRWYYLGRLPFDAGTAGYAEVFDGTGSRISADAVKFVYDDPLNADVSEWNRYSLEAIR